MPAFEYVEPATLEEAVAALAGDEARCLAGGVSLMVLMRNGLLAPRRLVNLKTIPGLDTIRVAPDGALRVGALATHRAIEWSHIVEEGWPLLARAAAQVASPVIRNMGTIGGNLCHGDPAADLPAALLALEARLSAVGPDGEREIPAEQFHLGYYETALRPGELLREIVLPPSPPGSRGVYLKLRRTATDLPIVGVAAQLALEGGRCRSARLAVSAAAAVPLRLREAEAWLEGRPVDPDAAAAAGALAQRAVEPLEDARGSAWYRGEMVKVMVARALLAAAQPGTEA